MLSQHTRERVELVFKVYWLSPFCTGTVELGETLLSWALRAERIPKKSFTDLFDYETKTSYQVKTGLEGGIVTFARLTTSSQPNLVDSTSPYDWEILGNELLEWVRKRIQEPREEFGAKHIKVARIVYTRDGNFTYYERHVDPDQYDPSLHYWEWRFEGSALNGYLNEEKWFSWYPQGRSSTRNQNQLHFHGEWILMPERGSPDRHDFILGPPAQINFSDFIQVMAPLIRSR